jgi:2-aminoethylphosphonate-pyruvate transaminase
MLLMNPGPVTLTERVRHSLLQPDLCHRENEFFDLQDEVRSGLLTVYALHPSEWAAALITGSGTAAVESMITSLLPAAGRVLIIINGVYGERIQNICERYQIPAAALSFDYLKPLSLDAIRARLQTGFTEQRFSHVAVIHHETTIGRLNDLRAIADLCGEYGAQLLVDAVSSFGAEQICFEHSCLSAVACTANKCLHGVPGVSFVIARRAVVAKALCRTYYLDLVRLIGAQDRRNTPFTPAVHAYYALAETLREFAEEGGREARHRRYTALADQVKRGLSLLGINATIPESQSSVVLRSYNLPEEISYSVLHARLKAVGFIIYAGQASPGFSTGSSSNALRFFRISTMGSIESTDISRFLRHIEELIYGGRS